VNENVLLAQGQQIARIPRKTWEEHLSQVPQHANTRLSFMSEEHHLIRYFVVRELPRTGKPMSPEFIAQNLKLPPVRVKAILDELERNLFFLVRNEQGAVAWAFPVTVDPTPHELTISTGEQLYGAWSGRRDSSVLRARAITRRTSLSHNNDGMCALRSADADRGG